MTLHRRVVTARSDVLVLSICAAVLAMVAIRQLAGDHARDVMWWLTATLVLAAGVGVMMESCDNTTYSAPHRHTPAPMAELPMGLAMPLLTAQPPCPQTSAAPAPTAPMSVSATREASCAPSPSPSRASDRASRAPHTQPSNPQSPAPPPSPHTPNPSPHTPKPSPQPSTTLALSTEADNDADIGIGRLARMQRQRDDAMALAAVATDGPSHKRTRAQRTVVELAQIPDISTAAYSRAQPDTDFARAGSTISSALTTESAYERSVAARFRRMRL